MIEKNKLAMLKIAIDNYTRKLSFGHPDRLVKNRITSKLMAGFLNI